MMPHNAKTTSRRRQTPTAAEDREVIAAYERAIARQCETMDARARWLGYRGEADFTDRAAAQLARHPTLPRHLARHARFIYLGTGQ
ncbi:MAG: hypothetical protein Q8Q29_07610 [Actinomycetota bacterium]|nr:hypothetical protein [Actinomycetota bacterium]